MVRIHIIFELIGLQRDEVQHDTNCGGLRIVGKHIIGRLAFAELRCGDLLFSQLLQVCRRNERNTSITKRYSTIAWAGSRPCAGGRIALVAAGSDNYRNDKEHEENRSAHVEVSSGLTF